MPNPERLELVYTGSVKNVYRDKTDARLNSFEFTDDYSVFDWGKMPDTIAHKGRALSIFGGKLFRLMGQPEVWQKLGQSTVFNTFENQSYFQQLFAGSTFNQLQKTGMAHHFKQWVDDNAQPLAESQLATLDKAPLLQVDALDVKRPEYKVENGQGRYTYPQIDGSAQPVLVPLEVIFRFGMPSGSSLKKRLEKNPGYYQELGLSHQPGEGQWFERPVIEYFTKLEPEDRFLTLDEARRISSLPEARFQELADKAQLLALWLYDFFAQAGIELWDGKFEFAWTPDGIALVDSIGPDELRLMRNGVHLSKEVIRRFYRGSDWEKAVQKAKEDAKTQPERTWKAICQEDYQAHPQPLTAEQKQPVNNLYGALVNHCLKEQLIPCELNLDAVVQALAQEPVGAR